ncbi:MAG: DUF6896 domain-containing protein [Planctomycetota bacterium]|jgi:hypothetical protein
MTEPIRLTCKNVHQVPSIDEIKRLAGGDQHVVLQFPRQWYRRFDKQRFIRDLSNSLAEYYVFDSGGDANAEWVTVMRLVERERVVAKLDEIQNAVAAYRELCGSLIDRYENGSLSDEWDSHEHGEHCRFESKITGQIIEAPLSGIPRLEEIDPYFLEQFVKSTSMFKGAAGLMAHEYHDAVRILDILLDEEWKTQQRQSGGL